MALNHESYLHSTHSPSQQVEKSTNIQFSLWHTFKHHIPRFLLTILFDLVLPLILFFVLQKHMKSVYALLIAGAPPLVMVVLKAIVSRRFDALGFLVFISFLISAIVAVVTHNDIILLLEKSLVTAIISIVFGITLIPCPCCRHRWHWRPLAYYFYQDLVPTKRADVGLPDNVFDDINKQNKDDVSVEKLAHKEEVAQVYEWIYTQCSSFRLSCYFITSIWSVGFFLEFLARLILILVHLSVNRIVIYGHVILGLITVACILSTIICITKERKRTLAFIKQWKEQYWNTQQQRQRRRSSVSVWVIADVGNRNNIAYEMSRNEFSRDRDGRM